MSLVVSCPPFLPLWSSPPLSSSFHRELFLTCQRVTGAHNPEAYHDAIGASDGLTVTPASLAIRVLLRHLHAMYHVYKPEARLGTRYARQVFSLRNALEAPPTMGVQTASAGPDDASVTSPVAARPGEATLAGSTVKSMWLHHTTPSSATASGLLSHTRTSATTRVFTDTQDALAHMKVSDVFVVPCPPARALNAAAALPPPFTRRRPPWRLPTTPWKTTPRRHGRC